MVKERPLDMVALQLCSIFYGDTDPEGSLILHHVDPGAISGDYFRYTAISRYNPADCGSHGRNRNVGIIFHLPCRIKVGDGFPVPFRNVSIRSKI